VSLYPQFFSKFSTTKTLLPFLPKGEKTAELVFLFLNNRGTGIQISTIYSFLIHAYSKLIQSSLIQSSTLEYYCFHDFDVSLLQQKLYLKKTE
jgi:hypothetical protein